MRGKWAVKLKNLAERGDWRGKATPSLRHTHTRAHTRTSTPGRPRAGATERPEPEQAAGNRCRVQTGQVLDPQQRRAAAASPPRTVRPSADLSLMLQDFSDQRDMAKQPPGSPAGLIPTQQQPDGAAGRTTNKPDHHPAPQPPCSESKTFCPTESKPADLDSSKAYGTFRNSPPAVPGSAAAHSGSVHGDPLRATAEHNNTAGGWTAMSQTTIILGTDGNTSVQPGAVTGVS